MEWCVCHIFNKMYISLFLQSVSCYSFQSLDDLDDHLNLALICTYFPYVSIYYDFWLIPKTGSNTGYMNKRRTFTIDRRKLLVRPIVGYAPLLLGLAKKTILRILQNLRRDRD